MVNVINGTATVPIDTTGLTGGEYKLQTTYTDGNYYGNAYTDTSILKLEEETWTRIGYNTDNPWTDTMKRGGTIIDGKLWVYYANTPMILNTIRFDSDFKVTVRMGMDEIGGGMSFGFTTNPTTTANKELHIDANNTVNGINIPQIITTAGTAKEMTIERTGNSYKLSYDDNICTVPITTAQPVYFYVEKSGSYSYFIETIEYTGGGDTNIINHNIPCDDTTLWTCDNGSGTQIRTIDGKTGIVGGYDGWAYPINLELSKDKDYDISVDLWTNKNKGYLNLGLCGTNHPLSDAKIGTDYVLMYYPPYSSSDNTWRYTIDDNFTQGYTGNIDYIQTNVWTNIIFKKRGYDLYVTFTKSNGEIVQDLPVGLMKNDFTFYIKQWNMTSIASNLCVVEYPTE